MSEIECGATAGLSRRIVRSAQAGDARDVAGILARAFPGLYTSTFGRRDPDEVTSLLQALYDSGHLSLDETRVCEIDGCIVAVMILHTGLPIGRGSAGAFWRLIRQRYGWLRAPRIFAGGILANLMLDRRIPRAPDLVYIEALAVAEEHRGRGVGSLLLADAEQCARASGRSRIALHVLAGNAGARRLYERTGFRLWYEADAGHRWRLSPRSGWVALLMARRLDQVRP